MDGEGVYHNSACVGLWPLPSPMQRSASTGSKISGPEFNSATKHLTDIEVDYGTDILEHRKEDREIRDCRNGARWRTSVQFESGMFSARIKTLTGNTSGLNRSFYLSSLEGDKSQDEIEFEFLGKDKSIIQTNVYTNGTGIREVIHKLGFDSSQDFHGYAIHWSPQEILWYIDGVEVRKVERKEGEDYPTKPMFLYASVWMLGISMMGIGLAAMLVVTNHTFALTRMCKSLTPKRPMRTLCRNENKKFVGWMSIAQASCLLV